MNAIKHDMGARRGQWRALNLVSLLLAALLLAGCNGAGAPTKGEVTVVVAVPLSGWQADGGQTVLGGARLAAEEINKSGGLLGYRVLVRGEDDEADSDVAVEVANSVVAAVRGGERVVGVIGHYNSGQCEATLGIYEQVPVIVITPTASDPALTRQGYRNFFRVNATDAAQGPFDAEFMVQELGAQRIVVVYADNAYGRGLQAELLPALEKLGRPAVLALSIPEGASTYAEFIPRIQAANPDAVFLAGYETEGYVLLPELREAGVTATFMGSDGCFLYDFVDGSGQWAEGAYVSGITPDPKAVADDDWWRAYQVIEARNPGTYSVAGYSAMMALAEGVRQAKSLEAGAVSQALRQLDLKTLVGQIRYDDHGDLLTQQVYIFRVEGGEFVQVLPKP
jgi:branched-chain amino acid transport system substrate-binding protein